MKSLSLLKKFFLQSSHVRAWGIKQRPGLVSVLFHNEQALKCKLLTSLAFVMYFSAMSLRVQGQDGSALRMATTLLPAEPQASLALHKVVFRPHSSIDTVEFAKQYRLAKAWWDKAFDYMRHTDLSALKPGTYPILGEDVFIKVTEAPSKDLDSTRWEAHRHYHDIHYIISGKEKIGKGAVSLDTPITSYDTSRDITFYKNTGEYYLAEPGQFFIFFTKDAHRPFIKEPGFDIVKRFVIKVREVKE